MKSALKISLLILVGFLVWQFVKPTAPIPPLAVGVDFDENPGPDRYVNQKLTGLLRDRYPVGTPVEKVETDLTGGGWGPVMVGRKNPNVHPVRYVQYRRSNFKLPFLLPLEDVTTISWEIDETNNTLIEIVGGFRRDCGWCL